MCGDFKLFAPAYFREAKMATVKRELETVYRYHHHHDEGDEGDESEEEELQEKVLRFSYDGSLPVDRKLLKPLFHIEALRSANGINATLPRLHNHKDCLPYMS